MLKTTCLILLHLSCTALGNLVLACGMRQKVMNLPHVLAGTAIMTLGYAVYLALLKQVPLSVLVPAGAGSYLMIAAVSRLVLHEAVSPMRWFGALVVTLGVTIVMFSDWQSQRCHAAPPAPPAKNEAKAPIRARLPRGLARAFGPQAL